LRGWEPSGDEKNRENGVLPGEIPLLRGFSILTPPVAAQLPLGLNWKEEIIPREPAAR
jgi:hypothetical protein